MKQEKRSEIIHEALNMLDDEMIEEVDKLRGIVKNKELNQRTNDEKLNISVKNILPPNFTGKKNWYKWTALAASICVLITGSWIYEVYLRPAKGVEKIPDSENESVVENKENDKQIENAEDSLKQQNDRLEEMETPAGNSLGAANAESLKSGVTIPKMEVNLKKAESGEVQADMLGFFILNGRSYIQYEFQNDYTQSGADFVGEYVGHITGMIDEWTKEEGYVDGAGTYPGDVYEVKGISPEFMLCMVWDDGTVETFINHNDITLYKGSDLIDEWLDLRGNFDAISSEAIMHNQFVHEELSLSEEEMDVFADFLDAFAEGEFVYVEEKMEHPYGGDMDTPDMMDFYFVKENGVRLRFRTLGDGYVSFPWIDACVKIDQGIYDAVVDILLGYENNKQ